MGTDTRCRCNLLDFRLYSLILASSLLKSPVSYFLRKAQKKDLLSVPEQAQLLVADLDWAAAELRNQDLVAGLDAGRNALSVLVNGAGADGNHLGLVEVLDGCLGEEDASGGLGFGLDALHENAVEEGCNAADRLDGGLGGDC